MENVFKVKTAVGKEYRKPLYHRNLTTAGFMQFQPLFYREVIPFGKVKGRFQIWSRTNPLVLPTMGTMNYHYARYFVRYKDIWPAWDDFYNKSYHAASGGAGGFVTRTPRLNMQEIWNLINNAGYFTSGDASSNDFGFYDSNNHLTYYKYTPKGRNLIKIFESLGIRLSWNERDTQHINLLPLMALAKVYIDYYYPKSWTMGVNYQRIKQLFALNILNYDYSSTVVQNGFQSICNLLSLGTFYDNDGLYLAWNNPVGPSETSAVPAVSFTDDTVNNGNVVVADGGDRDSYGTPVMSADGAPGSTSYGITKFGLSILKRISDMVKRYQLAGNEAVDRFFARFGLPLTDSHMAKKLGFDEIPVRVGDVESNSDSSVTIGGNQFSSVLGDLAGKGVSSGQGLIEYKNDSHFGILIGVFSVVPDAGLYQGVDKMNLHINPEHFYNPEYDALGVDLVTNRELLVTNDGSDNTLDNLSHSYGLLPRGYEYTLGRNILSGLFTCSSVNRGLDAYHLYRNLRTSYLPGEIETGLNFMGATDATQFNRLFYNSNAIDQFFIRFRCNFEEYSTKKPLSESYDWEDDGNKVVHVDGNLVDRN